MTVSGSGPCSVMSSGLVAVAVGPAILVEDGGPVGFLVVAVGWGISCVAEELVSMFDGGIHGRVVGEAVDEPFGCVRGFGIESVFGVFDVGFAVGVDGGWCEDLSAFASDVESWSEAVGCVVSDFYG